MGRGAHPRNYLIPFILTFDLILSSAVITIYGLCSFGHYYYSYCTTFPITIATAALTAIIATIAEKEDSVAVVKWLIHGRNRIFSIYIAGHIINATNQHFHTRRPTPITTEEDCWPILLAPVQHEYTNLMEKERKKK